MLLHKSKNKCTEKAMYWAARNGHLEVLKYLHEVVNADCPFEAVNWAARNGHLEVLKYLHE
eukprot:Pgem_evm1s8163